MSYKGLEMQFSWQTLWITRVMPNILLFDPVWRTGGDPPNRRADTGKFRLGVYLQAVTMISTSSRGSARSACTHARAGALPAGSQAVHTSFIASRSRMSFTQI
jgi:hypothetical protein